MQETPTSVEAKSTLWLSLIHKELPPLQLGVSSNFKELRYDEKTEILFVEFLSNGKLCAYENVPVEIVESLFDAYNDPSASVGKKLGELVIGKQEKYPFSYVEKSA
jgi:hypothetical protein